MERWSTYRLRMADWTVHHARTIAQVPAPMKWSIHRIQEMPTTPWTSNGPTEPGVIHHQPTDQVKTTTKTPTIRRLYLRQDDLDTHGYTQNCPKCQHTIVHGQSTPATMNHSAKCRTRLTEAIASTTEGQARLSKLVEKENRHPAEHLRQQVEDDPTQAQGGMSSSNQARETVPPPLDLLPFSPTAENPTTLEDHNKPPTDEALVRDVLASPRNEVEPATGVSASESDHGAIAGDMDFDVVLRQDRRDLRAALELFRSEERSEAKTRYGDAHPVEKRPADCGRLCPKCITHQGPQQQRHDTPDWE